MHHAGELVGMRIPTVAERQCGTYGAPERICSPTAPELSSPGGCLKAHMIRGYLDPVRQEAARDPAPPPVRHRRDRRRVATACPTDLGRQAGGRPAIHDRRELVNAMAYWLQAGCAWQLLPHDLPPWQIEPGSGVPPSPSPSRSAAPSSASPCGSSSSRPAQRPEDNFRFTVADDQELRAPAQRLNRDIS